MSAVSSKTSIPPPSTGYWAWVRDELRIKADEKWVTSEISSLRRMFDDTKVTATDARKAAEKPYVCRQEGEIEKLKNWKEQVMNWKIPIIISIIVLILGAAGQYFSLKDSVEDSIDDRALMQKTLKKIEIKQEETSEIIEDIVLQEERNKEERSEELKAFLKEVVSEIKNEEPRRNRRARGN